MSAYEILAFKLRITENFDGKTQRKSAFIKLIWPSKLPCISHILEINWLKALFRWSSNPISPVAKQTAPKVLYATRIVSV